MTGGQVVILGEVGNNFGAGMTGGMAFIYDAGDSFMDRVNPASLEFWRIASVYWSGVLRSLVEEHVRQTESSLDPACSTSGRLNCQNSGRLFPLRLFPCSNIQ